MKTTSMIKMAILLPLLFCAWGCGKQTSSSQTFMTLEEVLRLPSYQGWTVVSKPSVTGPFRVGTQARTDKEGEPLKGSFTFEWKRTSLSLSWAGGPPYFGGPAGNRGCAAPYSCVTLAGTLDTTRKAALIGG
jgi:hypothetical protein